MRDQSDNLICIHCGVRIRECTIDPGLPWVHDDSGNGFCRDQNGVIPLFVDTPDEAAARTSAEPYEGALEQFEESHG